MKIVVKHSTHNDRRNRHYWWCIIAANGQVVATSETYRRKESALDTIATLKGADFASVPVEDEEADES